MVGVRWVMGYGGYRVVGVRGWGEGLGGRGGGGRGWWGRGGGGRGRSGGGQGVRGCRGRGGFSRCHSIDWLPKPQLLHWFFIYASQYIL